MKEQEKSIGAIWTKVSQKGTNYLSISLDGANNEKYSLIAFQNTRKKNEREPDYRIYKQQPRNSAVVETKKQIIQEWESTSSKQDDINRQFREASVKEEQIDFDQIPF